MYESNSDLTKKNEEIFRYMLIPGAYITTDGHVDLSCELEKSESEIIHDTQISKLLISEPLSVKRRVN